MADVSSSPNVSYVDPSPLAEADPDAMVPEVDEYFSFPERPAADTGGGNLSAAPIDTTVDGLPLTFTHIEDTRVPKTIYSIDWTLSEIVTMFVVYAFIIAAALSAIYIFVGGMSFILSGGNEEKVKSAVNTIRYAIVGLIVTILSFFAVNVVGRMFGFNFLDYLSYGQIKANIEALMESGLGDTPSNTVPFSEKAAR